MALTVKLISKKVTNTGGDNYTISAKLQLLDGATVMDEKELSMSFDRYAGGDNLRKWLIDSFFKPNIADWKKQIVKASQVDALLSGFDDML